VGTVSIYFVHLSFLFQEFRVLTTTHVMCRYVKKKTLKLILLEYDVHVHIYKVTTLLYLFFILIRIFFKAVVFSLLTSVNTG